MKNCNKYAYYFDILIILVPDFKLIRLLHLIKDFKKLYFFYNKFTYFVLKYLESNQY